MKLSHLLFFIGMFAFTSCKGQDVGNTISAIDQSSKIEVIDFYGAHRCFTCEAIESNAKFTVETFFKEEVANGKLSFKTVNVDDEANYDIAERFEAAGTALFLNIVKGGKEHHIDLTNFAFLKGTDKEKFSTELKAKIQEQLLQL